MHIHSIQIFMRFPADAKKELLHINAAAPLKSDSDAIRMSSFILSDDDAVVLLQLLLEGARLSVDRQNHRRRQVVEVETRVLQHVQQQIR